MGWREAPGSTRPVTSPARREESRDLLQDRHAQRSSETPSSKQTTRVGRAVSCSRKRAASLPISSVFVDGNTRLFSDAKRITVAARKVQAKCHVESTKAWTPHDPQQALAPAESRGSPVASNRMGGVRHAPGFQVSEALA